MNACTWEGPCTWCTETTLVIIVLLLQQATEAVLCQMLTCNTYRCLLCYVLFLLQIVVLAKLSVLLYVFLWTVCVSLAIVIVYRLTVIVLGNSTNVNRNVYQILSHVAIVKIIQIANVSSSCVMNYVFICITRVHVHV